MKYSKRVENLIEYVSRLSSGEDGKTLYDLYRVDLEAIEPQEAFEVFHKHLDGGAEVSEILGYLDKVINVFYKSLLEKNIDIPPAYDFLLALDRENTALVHRVDALKKSLSAEPIELKKKECLESVNALGDIIIHFQKKENILFPFMEKASDKFTGLTIMWALHDRIKGLLKNARRVLNDDKSTLVQVNSAIAELIFALIGLVKKERLILFPSAIKELEPLDFEKMHHQSFDYGFAFIEAPPKPSKPFGDENGHLDFDEIMLIFNTLPVDLTFVDADNKVKFFSRPEDRIFPRSSAVIGRDVKFCHPPHSVHVVEEILESFKAGKQSKAEFWIDIKDRKLHIRYFALRDSKGVYRGTLEVSQDITEVQKITGQRRLLEWEKE